MKSKGSCLALVCVSIKFIDFIVFFFVSLLTHFKRKTKNDIKKTNNNNKKKQKTKKQKQNKQKQNPH